MQAVCFRVASLFTALSLLVLGVSLAFADQTWRVEMGPGNAFVFRPTSFTAVVGETITVVAPNLDTQRPHDIAISGPGGFSWELVPGNANIAVGQTGNGTLRFTTPGTYEFWCPVGMHRQQGMVASLTVTAGPASQLPRTGDPMTLLAGSLGALGALAFAGGLYLRRR